MVELLEIVSAFIVFVIIVYFVTQKDNKTNKGIKKVDYTGTWGIYQGRYEDKDDFFNLIQNSLVFQCVANDSNMLNKDMLILKYGKQKFRVNSECYKVVKEPTYKIGDNVEIIEKSLIGQITDIHWHFKDEIPFYFLKIEEKKLKRRYKESELRKVMNLSLDNVHIAKYEMKFMFDWKAGTCVWSTNEAAEEKYDYPVEISSLPISQDLANILESLCEKHDEALDWDCPNNGLLWNLKEQESFFGEAKNAYEQLCDELGDEYSIVFWSNCII